MFADYCVGGIIPCHTPLVMEGRVSEEDMTYGFLWEGRKFPIDTIWIPKTGFDRQDVKYFMTENLQWQFGCLMPYDILSSETIELSCG